MIKMAEEKVLQDDKTYMLYKSETDSLSGSFRVILRGELLRFIWTPSDPNEQVTRNDFVLRAVPDAIREGVFHTNLGSIVLLEYATNKMKDTYKKEARLILEV